jgi:hypothetical protein
MVRFVTESELKSPCLRDLVLPLHRAGLEAIATGARPRARLWLLRAGRIASETALASDNHRAEVARAALACPAELAVLSDEVWMYPADEDEPARRREALITDALGRDRQLTVITEIEHRRPGAVEFGPTETSEGLSPGELGPLWSILDLAGTKSLLTGSG